MVGWLSSVWVAEVMFLGFGKYSVSSIGLNGIGENGAVIWVMGVSR